MLSATIVHLLARTFPVLEENFVIIIIIMALGSFTSDDYHNFWILDPSWLPQNLLLTEVSYSSRHPLPLYWTS